MRYGLAAACLLLSVSSFSQKVTWNRFTLTEENDFLNILPRGLDRYYSQGLRLALNYQHEHTRHWRLIHPGAGPNAVQEYEVSLTQQLFTPSHTQTPFFQFTTDRPYAACAFLSHAAVSTDTITHNRFTSRLDIGIMGPAALGQEIQTFFHTLTREPVPQGWGNQMQNDIYLNYLVEWNKELRLSKKLIAGSVVQINAGTIYNNAAVGLSLRTPPGNLKNLFRYEFFFRPTLRLVLYNSLLQGGLLAHAENNIRQYFLTNTSLLVGQGQAGFAIKRKKKSFVYSTTFLTREFHSGFTHFYSGITLGFDF
ncbi:MAG: lipid A deacylase LpxR family protein [Cyclobacteriaceae bacterium]